MAPGWFLERRWRRNGRDSPSNHQPHDCLLPAQMASNAENVSIWWRHHGLNGMEVMLHMKSCPTSFAFHCSLLCALGGFLSRHPGERHLSALCQKIDRCTLRGCFLIVSVHHEGSTNHPSVQELQENTPCYHFMANAYARNIVLIHDPVHAEFCWGNIDVFTFCTITLQPGGAGSGNISRGRQGPNYLA